MFFDAHADVLNQVGIKRALGEKNVFRKYHYQKYLKSGIDSSIFVIWLDPNFEKTPREDFEKMLKASEEEFEETQDIIFQVKSFKDFELAKKENKLGIILGSESLVHIGKELEYLYFMYQKGFRHASLTWNERNELATGVDGEGDLGLTGLGKQAIRIMEELGMIVDVSHLNEKSFWDVTKIITKPIIASHSNSYDICPAKRNLTQEQIKEIAKTGGVIGMNCYNGFVAEEEDKKTIQQLVSHVVKIAELVGTEHVGCGFDFLDFYDYPSPGIQGLFGADQAQNFIVELEKAGFNKEEIEQIKYKNFMRVIENILK